MHACMYVYTYVCMYVHHIYVCMYVSEFVRACVDQGARSGKNGEEMA
jgi:hypothetical protein